MPEPATPPARRIAFNTVIFSIATGLSRVAGLVREVVASSYFGTSGPFSAFTIAFQVPNLLRALVADSALSAAFVPVFTELLEQKKRKEAFQLAGALFGLILVVLGALTLLFIVIAPWVIPPITGDKFSAELDQLTVGLSRVMFPIVVLLGLNGLVVGILNAYDHFAIPAIAPGGLEPRDHRRARRAEAAVRGPRTRSTPTRWACSRARSSSSGCACRCCAASASS